MKKLLGVAAAALVLSAGSASATNIHLNFTFNGQTFACTLDIERHSNSSRSQGHISNNVLLTAFSSDCSFYGLGTIGESELTLGSNKATHLATISGFDSLAQSFFGVQAVEVLLNVDANGDFVDGNKYRVYATTDGTTLTWVGKGTYTVGP
jgi:hypothetical protein